MRKFLVIKDIGIEVTEKDIKNFHLTVSPPEGNVKITVPLKTDEEIIRIFLISKIQWLKKQILKIQNQYRLPRREYITGEKLYFKGDKYILDVNKSHLKRKSINIKNKKTVELKINFNTTLEEKVIFIDEWYRKELKIIISQLIPKWEEKIGVKSKFFGIKKMKRKWGSCISEKSRVWFNLHLAKKNEKCIEYVVVHELLHLKEKAHNKKFYGELNRFLPDWERRKEELNNIIFE